MKASVSSISKPLTIGTRLVCADNSGAKQLEIIGVRKYQGVRRRYPKAGIGSIVTCSVKKGNPNMRKKKVQAIIIRQRKEYRRPDGMRIQFDDNAAVLLDPEKGVPVGTEIKGVLAREVAKGYPKIAGIAAGVV